jgi:probable HAF family extracellular repeat protein
MAVYGSGAWDINNSGQVVGVSASQIREEAPHGFLYDASAATPKMIDLNTLIPADSGWTIRDATAINSKGKIAATGHKDGVGTHALLLTPTSGPNPLKITSPLNNTLYDPDGSFSVSGTAPAGSTVELFEGTTSQGTTKADSSSGAWSMALSGVSEGAHTYTAKATDAAGNTYASNSVTVTVDMTAPKVSEVYPANGATGAGRNTDIAASFTEKMDSATFTTSTVTLVKEGTTPISVNMGLMDTKDKVWISTWSVELDANTKYTVKIKGGTNGVKDLTGNALGQDYSWTFTTVDVPPSVVSYTPTQTSSVPRNIRPTATFSTNMDPSTITATNIKFEVYDSKRSRWISVTHTVSYDAPGKTATVIPGSTLAASKDYRVTVTTNVKSSTGVALDQDANITGSQPMRWRFTTGSS